MNSVPNFLIMAKAASGFARPEANCLSLGFVDFQLGGFWKLTFFGQTNNVPANQQVFPIIT
jgi:hypothetical protein